MPIPLWPAVDQAAWQAALKAGDVFEPGGVASRWSPATQRKTVLGYGRFLFWLTECGELDTEAAPPARVTRERVAAYLDELRHINRGHTIQNRTQELGDAMRAIAPDRDWRWLLRAAGRIRAGTLPVQDKRGRLRPIGELAGEGDRMMAEADADQSGSALWRATLYRDGLLMAFLAFHPMRLRNLASLRIGHQIKVDGDQILINLTRSETKGRREYEAVLTPRLGKALLRYLDHYRPVLLKARGRWHAEAGDALWISKDGSPCSKGTFENIIRKRTAGPNRRPMSPHLFRSAAATSVAIRAPGSVDMIAAILGHGSPRTAERYYNIASSLEASRAHGAVLEQLLDELTKKRQRSTRARSEHR